MYKLSDVGTIGVGEFRSCRFNEKKQRWEPSPEYRTWYQMLKRCYDTEFQKGPALSYVGCSVDQDWTDYQQFCTDLPELEGYDKWYDYHYGDSEECMEIDKDLIIPGNQYYSKHTCKFISSSDNASEAQVRRWNTSDNYTPIQIGDVYSSNLYGDFEVIEYQDSTKVLIRFNNTGSTSIVKAHAARIGSVADPVGVKNYNGEFSIGHVWTTPMSGDVELVDAICGQYTLRFKNTNSIRVVERLPVKKGILILKDISEEGLKAYRSINKGDILLDGHGDEFVITKYVSAVEVYYEYTASGYSGKTTAQHIRLLRMSDKTKKHPSLKTKKKYEDKVFSTKKYGDYTVLEYKSMNEVVVKFHNTGNIVSDTAVKIKAGSVKDFVSKTARTR